MFDRLQIRGDLEPELAHLQWNSVKKAMKAVLADGSDFTEALLKLSIISNFGHGSFLTAEHGYRRREALLEYLQQQPPEFFETLMEDLCVAREQHVDQAEPFNLKSRILQVALPLPARSPWLRAFAS